MYIYIYVFIERERTPISPKERCPAASDAPKLAGRGLPLLRGNPFQGKIPSKWKSLPRGNPLQREIPDALFDCRATWSLRGDKHAGKGIVTQIHNHNNNNDNNDNMFDNKQNNKSNNTNIVY